MSTKEIQKILEENEKKYSIIFNTISDSITLTLLETGVFVDVNRGFYEISGYTKNDVIGKSVIELGIWKDEFGRQKLVELLKNDGYAKDIETQFLISKNRVIDVILSANIIELNGIKHILLITKDITKRKKLEKLLKKTLIKEQELANIVRDAPRAIAIGHLNGRISNFNDATIDLLGYTKEELEVINWIELTPSKWHKFEEEKLRELSVNKRSIIYEKEYIRKNGEIIPIEIHVSGIFNDKGELEKFIGFATDITNRRKMEDAIINNQLLKTVGEMASSVAHDFNNSLQSIIGNIELLLYSEEIPKKIKEYLDAIYLAAEDATQRVKLLQKFGDKKHSKNENTFIELEELFDEVIMQIRPLWKDKKEKNGFKIDIIRNYQKNLKIYGNIGELRTVFYNIIKNSIEAIPNNGKIMIVTKKINDSINIEISDTGIGMTSEIMGNIFKPFYSTKGFGVGRGLGMSGVFKIIQEYKGSIQVNSKLGEGTVFKVVLPYNEIKIDKDKDKNELIEIYSKELKILWIDDEKTLVDLAKKILKKLGYKANVAISGYEALKLLKNEKYDIVITDIGMPEMNGWQLIEEIRKQIQDIPKIIVLTGWGGEISEEEVNNYNIDGLLEKPVTIKQIKDIISKIMQNNSKKSN